MSEHDELDRLIDEYARKKIDRRGLIRGASALGLSTLSILGLLSGSAPAAASATGSARRPARRPGSTEPRTGGTFIEGYDRGFSPITTVSASWVDPTHEALLESLVSFDPDGNIVSDLAESWESNAEATEWTFKIKEGVPFHSGAELTPEIVVENLNTYRETGQHPYWFTQIDSVEVGSEPATVVVRTSAPFATLLELLQQPFTNMYNPRTAEEAGDGYGTQVVDGTGPFRLAEFDAASHVLVERFEEYAGTGVPWVENKGPAYVDAVRWVAINEAANRANEVISGTVHAIKQPLPADVENLKANSDLVVIQQQEAAEVVLGLNFESTQLGFDDQRVRKAVSAAIDRQAIVDTVLFGLGFPLWGGFPPNYKWYEPETEMLNTFDPDLARELLDEAGWTEGGDGTREKDGTALSFEVINQTDATRNLILEAMTAMLADVGVAITPRNLEAGAYFDALGTDVDAYVFPALWTDFPRIYQVLADSRFAPAPNWARAAVAEVDAAMDLWQFAANDDDKEAAARAIQTAIAEHLPVIPLYGTDVVWVHNSKVHGWRPTNPVRLYPYYNDVWLEE